MAPNKIVVPKFVLDKCIEELKQGISFVKLSHFKIGFKNALLYENKCFKSYLFRIRGL